MFFLLLSVLLLNMQPMSKTIELNMKSDSYLLPCNFADSELVPIGGRVCLVNLPKKKNIHKDLKSALQGIPGITNIVPAVTGNKKTRDPICKGFAYVDFKREEDAVRCVLTSILCLLRIYNPKKNNNEKKGRVSLA